MISKEVLLTTGIRFVIIILGFISSILTARFLGPVGRGEYFFVTTLAMLLTQFGHLGLASSNTYLVARAPSLMEKLLSNSVWISMVVGVLVSVITLAILMLAQISAPNGVWLLILLVPTSIFYLLGINLLVGLHKIISYNWFQIGSNLLIVLLMCLAGFWELKVYGFLSLSVLGWIVIAGVLFMRLRAMSLNNTSSFKFDLSVFHQGASFGAKAYIVTLLGLLVLKGNILILKFFADDQTLGYYSVASQLNDCLAILPASVGLILFPRLIQNQTNRWEEMKKNLLLITAMMFLSCVLAAILAPPFIKMAFGDHYLPAVMIFWWMLPGAFFLGLITILSQYLAAIGFPIILIGIWAVAFMVVTTFSWILIPYYQGKGGAMALSCAYGILWVMITILAIKKRQQES